MKLVFKVALVPLAFAFLSLNNSASGHTVFKKLMQKKFPETRVSCELCHTKGEPKTVRNSFGELFFEKTKELELTKKWEAFGEDKDGKRKFENEDMTAAFTKALDEIKVMKNADDVAYGELIAQAKLDGLKPKKKGSSAKDDDEDEDGEKNDGDKKESGKNDDDDGGN